MRPPFAPSSLSRVVLCTAAALTLALPGRVAAEALAVDALRAGDESAAASYQHLLARAEEVGSVPLIVGLSVPPLPEGSPADDDRQLRSVADAQDRLLAELAGFAIEPVKRFDTVPYLALTADAESLAALVRCDSVVSIQEDVAYPVPRVR